MLNMHDKYLKLKEKDSSKLYLFKCGKFYVFLDKDCDYINDYIVLKKVKFGKTYKCGFPSESLDSYLKVFKNNGFNVELVDDKDDIYDRLVKRVNNIDINQITPIEALNILKEVIENE